MILWTWRERTPSSNMRYFWIFATSVMIAFVGGGIVLLLDAPDIITLIIGLAFFPALIVSGIYGRRFSKSKYHVDTTPLKMPPIACPRCLKAVSDESTECPHCGKQLTEVLVNKGR